MVAGNPTTTAMAASSRRVKYERKYYGPTNAQEH
jgi:hypothetical protein